MIFNPPLIPTLSANITDAYRMDETIAVNQLITQAHLSSEIKKRILQTAEQLVTKTRENRKKLGDLDAFLHQYDLSSEEGIAIMCLAEALLRIPDRDTAIRLIKDKVGSADWQKYMGDHKNIFLNA